MKSFFNFIDNFMDTYRMTTIVILVMWFFFFLYLEKKYDSTLRLRRNNK